MANLITKGKGVFGQVQTQSLLVGGNTISGTEFAFLDGVTAGTLTASKALVVDANKKINELDITALKVNGTSVTATAAEINYLDLTTGAGTSEASKAVVLDAQSKISALDITALTINGTLITPTPAKINKLNVDGIVVVDKTSVDASAGGTAQTANCTLVPAGSIILEVVAVVTTAFDGDATTTVDVGVGGNADKYIDNLDFDPSAVADTFMSMTGGTNNDQKSTDWAVAGGIQVVATWTNTANAAAGAFDVYVVYANLA